MGWRSVLAIHTRAELHLGNGPKPRESYFQDGKEIEGPSNWDTTRKAKDTRGLQLLGAQ